MRTDVLDGTTTGIFGDFPEFKRLSIGMEPARNTASNQFFVKKRRGQRI